MFEVARMNPPHPPDPPVTPVDDTATGLPGLHSWRWVYLFVLGCFVVWVVLMVVFERLFT
jgi:hypothetical protein